MNKYSSDSISAIVHQIPAGLVMDRLIATHLFDCSDFWTDGHVLYGETPGERSMGIEAERVWIPNYSNNSHAARIVFDVLKQDGVTQVRIDSFGDGHWIIFWSWWREEEHTMIYNECVEAETLELAICRMALIQHFMKVKA